jgi:mutator protein MutT
MNKNMRLGVYGIIIDKKHIVLTTKVDGPFVGLLDLPGGGVEFGENAEQTLKRELKEEVAMDFSGCHLFDNLSYVLEEETFQQFGQIYIIKDARSIPNIIAEDPWDWYSLLHIDLEELTPFARTVIDRFRREFL